MPRIAGFGNTAVLALLTAGAAAEDERPANERAGDEYVAPRGPGEVHRDLNGIWQALNEATYDTELHMAHVSMQLGDGPRGPLPSVDTYNLGAVVVVPPGIGMVGGGAIPHKPEELQRKRENQADWINRDPEVKCYLPGVPRATYMSQAFQIFQGESTQFIANQYTGTVHDVSSEDPGPAPTDSWMGQSVASWDGDTLTVPRPDARLAAARHFIVDGY